MKKLLLFLFLINITLGYTQTPATGPALPPARNAWDVLSQFGSSYANLPGTIFQNFDGTTVFTDEILSDGSVVKKYTNHSISGISANGTSPLNVSQMTHLHIDVWSPNFTSMRIKLEASGGVGVEIDVPGGILQNAWNSFDIPLTSFAGIDLQDIRLIIPVTFNQNATLFVTNVYFYRPATMPSAFPVAPVRNAWDVLSQYSTAYANLPGTVFQDFDGTTVFSNETLSDGSVVKKYTNHSISGISANGILPLNVSQMTHLHIDVWSPNFTSMRVKLETSAGTGVEIDVPGGTSQGSWNSFDIPLTSFVGVDLQNIRWIIPVTFNQNATLFVTNVYFYRPATMIVEPQTALTPPPRNSTDVISQYGAAYTNLAGTVFQDFDGTTLFEDVTLVDGSSVKKYINHNVSGISANGVLPLDVSQMTHLHFDIWSTTFTSMRIKLEANDGTNFEIDVPGGTVQSNWNSFDIPLTSFAGVNLQSLRWIIPVTFNQNATLFVNNVYFYRPAPPLNSSVISGNQTINLGTTTSINVEITGGTVPYTVVYSDGINVTTLTNYSSNAAIMVTPTETTTYTLVSVTDAVGQVGTGNSGTAVITVTSLVTYFLDSNGNAVWSNTTGPNIALNAIIEAPYISSGDLFANNLTISPTGSFTLSANNTLTLAGSLTNNADSSDFLVANNANFIQTSNSVNSGQITVNRMTSPLLRLDFTMWSSPVSGQVLKNLSPATLNNRFLEYNSVDNTYVEVNPLTTIMTGGKGYSVRAPNTWSATVASAFNGTFIGVPNNGPYSVNVAVLGSRYYLIGNPYPSSLKLSNLYNNGNNHIGSTFHLYEHTIRATGTGSNYATYNAASNIFTAADRDLTDNPNTIPVQNFTGDVKAGQGFFVEALAGSGTILIENTMRNATINNVFLRSNNSTSNSTTGDFKIKLTSPSNVISEIALGFYQGASSVEDAFDSKTFDAEPLFYSIINANKFSIQGTAAPINDSSAFPLGFKAVQSGIYTINLASFTGIFEANQPVFIHDLFTNTYHNLIASPYTFTSISGDFTNRLVVVFSTTLSTNNPIAELVNAWVSTNASQLVVQVNEFSQLQEVTVFDLQGRKLYNANKINANQLRIADLVPSQTVLLVQIKLNNGEKRVIKTIF